MVTEMRLIDANALKIYRMNNAGANHPLDVAYRKDIDNAPAVDAVEVVHGRWERGYPISCSACGGAAATEYEDANRYEAWLSPHCPNCGAKMEVDND